MRNGIWLLRIEEVHLTVEWQLTNTWRWRLDSNAINLMKSFRPTCALWPVTSLMTHWATTNCASPTPFCPGCRLLIGCFNCYAAAANRWRAWSASCVVILAFSKWFRSTWINRRAVNTRVRLKWHKLNSEKSKLGFNWRWGSMFHWRRYFNLLTIRIDRAALSEFITKRMQLNGTKWISTWNEEGGETEKEKEKEKEKENKNERKQFWDYWRPAAH